MATQPFIFSHTSDVEDTKETCIARLANGERMRGCMRTVEYLHGWHTPNYPVPAINNEVWICWGTNQSKPYAFVSLVHNNGDESYTLVKELAEKQLI